MTGVAPSENFFTRDSTCCLAEFLDVLDSSIDFLLSNACLGNDPSDSPPMPVDDNGLAALYFVG
jgi:hypothetical protein